MESRLVTGGLGRRLRLVRLLGRVFLFQALDLRFETRHLLPLDDAATDRIALRLKVMLFAFLPLVDLFPVLVFKCFRVVLGAGFVNLLLLQFSLLLLRFLLLCDVEGFFEFLQFGLFLL